MAGLPNEGSARDSWWVAQDADAAHPDRFRPSADLARNWYRVRDPKGLRGEEEARLKVVGADEMPLIEDNIARLKAFAAEEKAVVKGSAARESVKALLKRARTELLHWREADYDQALSYAKHFDDKDGAVPAKVKKVGRRVEEAFPTHEWLVLNGKVADIRTMDLLCAALKVPVRVYVDSSAAPFFVGGGGSQIQPARLYWDDRDKLHVMVPPALFRGWNSLDGKFKLAVTLPLLPHPVAPPMQVAAGSGTPRQQLDWVNEAAAAEVEQERPEQGRCRRARQPTWPGATSRTARPCRPRKAAACICAARAPP